MSSQVAPTPVVVAQAPASGWRRTWQQIVRGARSVRRLIARNTAVNHVYRICVGVFGWVVVVIGLILVPLPGPGWLIVFAGFAVLATEFAWAGRVSAWVKQQVDKFVAWNRARRARKAAAHTL